MKKIVCIENVMVDIGGNSVIKCQGLFIGGGLLRENIMGVNFDNLDLSGAVKKAAELIASDGKHYVVTPNSEIVYMTRQNQRLKDILNGADLVLPDGIGIVRASSILGGNITEKVAGIDFAQELMSQMAKTGISLFLFGGKPDIAVKASINLKEKFPGLKIRGTHDGYAANDAAVIQMINESGAEVLFVCLGAPKQELWMSENLEKLNCKLAAGLGGSLDIFAGEAKRAPDIFIKAGLEWLYRLIKEPARLGRMMSLPKFLLWVIGSKMTGKTNQE